MSFDELEAEFDKVEAELNELEKLANEKIKRRIEEYKYRAKICDSFDKESAEHWRKQACYLENLLK